MTSDASPAAPSETQQQTERWRGVALRRRPGRRRREPVPARAEPSSAWSLLRPYRRWLVAMVGIVLVENGAG